MLLQKRKESTLPWEVQEKGESLMTEAAPFVDSRQRDISPKQILALASGFQRTLLDMPRGEFQRRALQNALGDPEYAKELQNRLLASAMGYCDEIADWAIERQHDEETIELVPMVLDYDMPIEKVVAPLHPISSGEVRREYVGQWLAKSREGKSGKEKVQLWLKSPFSSNCFSAIHSIKEAQEEIARLGFVSVGMNELSLLFRHMPELTEGHCWSVIALGESPYGEGEEFLHLQSHCDPKQRTYVKAIEARFGLNGTSWCLVKKADSK